MKLSIIFVALSSLLGLAAAQLGGLPKCAQDCANPAIPASCGLNVKCICTAKSFLDAITCCVAKSCTPAEQAETIAFANGICSTAGVTDLPQSVVCASSSAPSSSSAASTSSKPDSTSASSAAPTPSGSSNASSASSAPVATFGSASAASSGSATPTGNAAAMVVQNGGAAAAAAAIALALV